MKAVSQQIRGTANRYPARPTAKGDRDRPTILRIEFENVNVAPVLSRTSPIMQALKVMMAIYPSTLPKPCNVNLTSSFGGSWNARPIAIVTRNMERKACNFNFAVSRTIATIPNKKTEIRIAPSMILETPGQRTSFPLHRRIFNSFPSFPSEKYKNMPKYFRKAAQ